MTAPIRDDGVTIGEFRVSTKEEGYITVDGWGYMLSRFISRRTGKWVGWHVSKRTARGYSTIRNQRPEGFSTIDDAVSFIRSKGQATR